MGVKTHTLRTIALDLCYLLSDVSGKGKINDFVKVVRCDVYRVLHCCCYCEALWGGLKEVLQRTGHHFTGSVVIN